MELNLGPALLQKGKTGLLGATWPYDSRPEAEELKKKSRVTIFEQEGCGAVSHLHASNYIASGDEFGKDWRNQAVGQLVIRVYYDRETSPSIMMPFMDFLADIDYDSGFFSTVYFSKVKHSHNFRLVMPYREHIRIELENPTDLNMTGYTEIQWEAYGSLPANCGYLYADYRKGQALLPRDMIQLCDIRTQGAIAAHWYQVAADDPQCKNGERICEGNHLFYLDGEERPGIESQGTEDFYNYSWGFQDTQSDHYGAIIKRQDLEHGGSRIAVLRCRDRDAIRFEKSCRGVIDYTQEYFSALSKNPRHKNNNFHEFMADYKSCYYYYALRPQQEP